MALHLTGYGLTSGYLVGKLITTGSDAANTQDDVSSKLLEISQTYDASFRVEMHREHTVESFQNQVNQFVDDVWTRPKYGHANIGIYCDEKKTAIASLTVTNQYISLLSHEMIMRLRGDEIKEFLLKTLGVTLGGNSTIYENK